MSSEARAPLYFQDESRWKKYVHAGNDAADTDVTLFRQVIGLERGAVDAEQRTALFTISTEGRDRMGDRILVEGWKLKTFRKNPVVPWAHNHDALAGMVPIGKAVKVWRDVHPADGFPRLRALKQFTTRDENPFGAMIFDLIKGGYINTASVGFRPIKAMADDSLSDEEKAQFPWATLFKSQELLESSVVPIPANPEAIIEAKGLIDVSPYKSFTERILDGDLDPKLLEPALGDRAETAVERVYQIVTEGERFGGPTITVSSDSTDARFAWTTVSADSVRIVPTEPPVPQVDMAAIAETIRAVVREELRVFAPPPTEPKTNPDPEPDTDPAVNFKIAPEDIRSAFLTALGGQEKKQ